MHENRVEVCRKATDPVAGCRLPANDGPLEQRSCYESLLSLLDAAAPSPSLDALCFGAGQSLAYEFGADNASFSLCSSDGLSLSEHFWFKQKLLDGWRPTTTYSITVGRMDELALRGNVIEMNLNSPHPKDEDMSFLQVEYTYLISAPLISRSELIGVYSLLYKHERRPTAAECDLMVVFGGLLGSLIRQTRAVAHARDTEACSAYRLLAEKTSRDIASISRTLGSIPAADIAKTGCTSSFNAGRLDLGPASTQLLTARDIEVLTLLARGDSNDEIARSLYVSEITVKKQVSNLLQKLGLRNRVQLAVYAAKAGIVG